METKNYEYYIICIILLVVIISILFLKSCTNNSPNRNNSLIYVKSPLDSKKYLVQNLPNKKKAAYILSIINLRINILREYLCGNVDTYPEYRQYIKQFCERIKNCYLVENSPYSNSTSYTINKGDRMVLCLRSKKDNTLHNLNMLVYVTLHEIAHVSCPELNHTNLFKQLFKFFIKIAISLGIYNHFDYSKYPQYYCGIKINDNLV